MSIWNRLQELAAAQRRERAMADVRTGVPKLRASLAAMADELGNMIDFESARHVHPDAPGAAEFHAEFLKITPELKDLLAAGVTWLELVEPPAPKPEPVPQPEPQPKPKSSELLN